MNLCNSLRAAHARSTSLLFATAALAVATVASADPGPAEPVFTCTSAGAEQPLLRKLHTPSFPGTVRRQSYKYRRSGEPSPLWPVTTSFEIDADGRTRNISSTTTDPASFGQHANYAVSRWRFEPAREGATVAATGCTYQFTFQFAENVADNRSNR